MRRDARDGRALLHRSIAHCKLGRFEGESPPALPQPREAEPDRRWACCVRRQTPWRTQTRRCGSMAAVPRRTIDEGAISPSLCATATHTRTHNIPLSDPSPTLWRAHRVGCFQLGGCLKANGPGAIQCLEVFPAPAEKSTLLRIGREWRRSEVIRCFRLW